MRNIIELDGKKYEQTFVPYLPKIERPEKDKPRTKYDALIVLDIGHCEARGDLGAYGVMGWEYYQNKPQAYTAHEKLTALGYKNVKVVDEELSLSAIGAKYAKTVDIFLTFHNNAANKKAQGSEAFAHPNAPRQDHAFADVLAAQVAGALGTRNRGGKEMHLGVLKPFTYEKYSKMNIVGVDGAALLEGYFVDAPVFSQKLDRFLENDEANKLVGEAAAAAIDLHLDKFFD